MSITRILCTECGFPLLYCNCTARTATSTDWWDDNTAAPPYYTISANEPIEELPLLPPKNRGPKPNNRKGKRTPWDTTVIQ